MVVMLSLASSLFYGVADFLGGVAARRMPVVAMTTVNYAVSALVLLGFAAVVRMEVTVAAVTAGAVAGVFAVVGFLAFYGAFATGPISVLSPVVAAAQSVVPVAYDVLVYARRPSALGWAGIVVALVAGLLLGLSAAAPGTARVTARSIVLAVVAGIALGASTIALDTAPSDSGVLPVTLDVVTGLVVLLLVLLAARGSARVRRWTGSLDAPVDLATGRGALRGGGGGRGSALALAAFAGLLLGIGNVFLMFGLHAGDLAVVAVLMGLYPLSTVLLARALLGERLARAQVVGVAGALVACVLLGLA